MRPLAVFLVVLLVSVLPSGSPWAGEGRSAREILDRADDLFRGRSSHGRLTMKVKTANYAREMTLEAWSKGKDLSLVRILAPQKEKGTATLRSAENVWNWLPNVQRVVKVPSSLMGGSWMGSHFTHDDLVKQSRMADDFTYETTFEGARGGRDVVEVTLKPKPDAAVVWGKVVVVARGSDLLPVEIVYHDEDGALARTMVFSEFKDVGGRAVPVRWTVTPAGSPGESTEIVYHSLEFDVSLDDGFFSLQNLQR